MSDAKPKTPRKRRWGCMWVVWTILILLALGGVALMTPHPVVVSPETTYFTEPLDDNGRVDYFAALNREFSKGVTPENNAAIELLALVDHPAWEPETRHAFCNGWGIDAWPIVDQAMLEMSDKGFEAAARASLPPELASAPLPDRETLDEWLCEAQVRPWSAEEFPWLNAWIEMNEPVLEQLPKVLEKGRFFVPLVPWADEEEPPTVLATAYCELYSFRIRRLVDLLALRAQRRIHEGDLDGATNDLRLALRTCQLAGRNLNFWARPTALYDVGAAHRVHAHLVARMDQTSAWHIAQIDTLRATAPKGTTADAIDLTVRCAHLDMACLFADQKLHNVITRLDGTNHPIVFLSDWNEVARRLNDRYDDLVAAVRIPSRPKRVKAIEAANAKLDTDINAQPETYEHAWAPIATATDRSEMFVANFEWPAHWLWPEDRCAASVALLQVGHALAAYRADHGEYPDDLASLEQDYLPDAATDPVSEMPFVYDRDGDGYLLYSIGPDQIDGGGKEFRELLGPSVPEDFKPADNDDAGLVVRRDLR